MTASGPVTRLLTLVLVLAAAGLHGSAPAGAGEYPIRQCEGAIHDGFSGDYFQMNTLDRVDVVRGCAPGGANKIGIYQDRSGLRFQTSGGGQFMWSPVPGLQIVGTTVTAKLRDVNGIKATVSGPSAQWGAFDLYEGQPHDGQLRTTRWTGETRRPDLVVVRLRCEWANGCPNDPDGAKAYVEIFDLEIRSRDVAAPQLTPSGMLWERSGSGGWYRGDGSLGIESYDPGSGVARAWLEVNGFEVDLGAVDCAGDRGAYSTSFTPCPASVALGHAFDTAAAPFREGSNDLRLCVADFAIPVAGANRTCTASHSLAVDNQPSSPPAELEVVGGDGWRAENGFQFEWRIPDGQVSPVVAAEYRVLRADTGHEVDAGVVSSASLESAGPFEVPAPGEYRVEFRLRDEAGNLGSPASAIIRFDDSPPGDVSPEEPAGWISEDELPLRQPIERAVAGGPSGVGGYAVAVASDRALHPCAAAICLPGEMAIAAGPDNRVAVLDRLPEGSHWISAVAASGAMLASRQPGSTVVRVDRSDPETALDGVPSGWTNRPVTLTARASDPLSGMEPEPGRDDGDPVTVIAAEGQAPYESPGPVASFTVVTEGASRVEYWARDLAGNVNDGRPTPDGTSHRSPGRATVRIDMTSPVLRFETGRDPAKPEAVSVLVEDGLSGLDRGRIEMRRIGDGDAFVPLETGNDDSRLRATIPSDDLPAGTYELRAEAADRAGNTGTTVATTDGSAMVLKLPLKNGVGLSLRHRGKGPEVRRIVTRRDKGTTLVGRIRHLSGVGIATARLTVEERFADGSRVTVRRKAVVADGTGRFALRLKTGPSRRVRVLYSGTQRDSRAASRWLRFRTSDRVTLKLAPRVLRNGGRTVMRGAVKGRGAIQPAGGKLVAIQYYDPGRSRWRPVEVLRADRRGRFRYAYRFRTIASAQRILFRAVSLPEAGWPYRPSTSGAKSVIVYPKASSSGR
jgi:hypothetical protein